MNIRVLPSLHNREQWIAFCQREQPYCYVETPPCLVDFQTSYLQLTLFPQQGQAVKYSLGSRTSMEPAWQLIKACHWNLQALIDGLEKMDFSSNARDNALLKIHTDLTARKVFSREKLLPPGRIGLLQPLSALPAQWNNTTLCQLISHRQFQDLRSEQKCLPGRRQDAPEPPQPDELIQLMLEPDQPCTGQMQRDRLLILLHGQPIASLKPDLSWPQPRLK